MQFVPHSNSSIHPWPFLSLQASSMLYLVCPVFCSSGIFLMDEFSSALPNHADSLTSLWVILSCQHILNNCWRHLLWKTSISSSSLVFIFHVSQPHTKTGFTSGLYSLTLVHWLMLLLLKNTGYTPFAFTTLLWRSSVPPPYLETVASKYTNLSIYFISCLFTPSTSLFREFIHNSLHLFYLNR